MLLVFIILFIIIVIALFIFVVLLSTLEIKIKNFHIENKQKQENNQKIIIHISLLLGKLKWFSYKINKEKMGKMIEKAEQRVDIKQLEKEIPWNKEGLKELKTLQIQIKSFSLDAQIGTEDAILTSYLVAGIASMLSIVLPHLIKRINKNKHYYRILPIYENKNVYKINLNCIIHTKMVHIISVIYHFIKKGRKEKDERTSNRKSYDYSYEQH